MRSRLLGAHLGVSFFSGMNDCSGPTAPGELARGWQRLRWRVLVTFCSATVITPTLLSYIFCFLWLSRAGPLGPLVASLAYYTFQRWMSGLERR